MLRIADRIDTFLKKEKGTIFKNHGGKIRICLIYPNIYQIGIVNLGFQTVYRLFNQRKDVICERAFLPSSDEIRYYKESSIVSFESKTPLYEFDIVAFSLCFENDYPNILTILNLGKIPFYRDQRNSKHPLLVAGGVLCFSNPEPVADIFDIIFVGEAEELVYEFIDTCKTIKKFSYEQDFKGALKKEVLKLQGFYVPEAYKEIYTTQGKLIGRKSVWNDAPKNIKKIYCKEFSESFSFSQIITHESVFSDMYLIETMRGCPFKCRFCLVGHVYQPVRKASFEKLKEKIEESKAFASSIGIIAPSLTAYSELNELIKILDIELSFTSLRADRVTLEVLKELSRRKTLTLAPEAGSERLRRIIKKGIKKEDLLLIAQKLSETELENLKLYFMIGLPFENDEDIDEIVKLIKELRSVFNRKITASISIFVPKPHTPFQWHRMEEYEVVKERLKKLKKDTLQIKGFKLVHEVPKYSYMQGYFARADRRAISVIERVYQSENFVKILNELKESLYEIKAYEDYLPWDFIQHEGLSKENLWKEYEETKAEAFRTDSI